MALGQYDGLGEYCGPHTASSVFLVLVFTNLQQRVTEPSGTISYTVGDPCRLAGPFLHIKYTNPIVRTAGANGFL